jgi:hypothetical protein
MMRAPNRYRIRTGMGASSDADGCNGAFLLPGPIRPLFVICSDGMGWEHVSVSIGGDRTRTPNWLEMCHVKGVFWDDEDVVMQLHPRASEYVNHHAGCLHLWRPIGVTIPTPPMFMVGPAPAAGKAG